MSAKTKPSAPPVVRTSAGLRDVMFDELDFVRNGDSNPTRANAVAKLCTGIMDSVRVDVEVAKYAAQAAGVASVASALPEPIRLGS